MTQEANSASTVFFIAKDVVKIDGAMLGAAFGEPTLSGPFASEREAIEVAQGFIHPGTYRVLRATPSHVIEIGSPPVTLTRARDVNPDIHVLDHRVNDLEIVCSNLQLQLTDLTSKKAG